MVRVSLLAAALVLASCSTTAVAPPPPAQAPACDVSGADRAWIERALTAWRYTKREITHIETGRTFQAIFFDGACVLTSDNALTSDDASVVTWSATPHQGAITLPGGGEMPAGVTSFASGEGDVAFFVMSTPSVWSAGGVPPGPLGLETLMVAVLLHEGSHVAQAATYGAAINAIAQANNLSDDFNDDTMQHEFGETPEFAASVERETQLFLESAAAPDDATARRLAREARAMMQARAARWFVGDKAYYAEAEDIWLTFEGSGQWAGYHWLVDPNGGAFADEAVYPGFAIRSRWWSQKQGFAIAHALDRLDPDWALTAFGDGSHTMLQMLDAALAS